MTAQAILYHDCSWCHRQEVDGLWLRLPIPDDAPPLSISHGICPECEAKIAAEIDGR